MPQIISQKPNQISLKAWAKINLTLEVLKKRKDSFHEIRSIITPIPLFDLIKVKLVFPKKNTTTAPPEPKIIITTNNKLLAREKKNNCYKAAQFITSRLPKNKIPASIKIHLEKNIPLAGGLGGSSADTAAVIIAFDKLFSLKLSKQEQLKILARFSSEAASLLPGVIITRGRGETAREITQKPLKLPLVLITFKDKLTTRDIFKNFNPPAGPKNRATISKKLAMTLKTAFKKTSRPKNLPGLISPFLLNHLELCPKINQTRLRLVKQRLKSTGALNALMSGAGSTIYGIYPNNYTLKQASNILKKHYSIIILPQ